MKFKSVDPQVNFFEQEEEILNFWKKNKIFEKSIEQRSADNPASFYDGPPFVTGVPHYGHLLGSIAKDIIPRYLTMKGKRVRRVWGWDCHGLPVENKVEKKLGLKNRKDIEKIGLGKFIAECKTYVSETSAEWNWYVDHSGRWVDMEHAYRTMDLSYMESVIWAFKELYDKNLIYKGMRISLFCPRCSTPISNFEIAMDNSYAERKDTAITMKFKIKGNAFGDKPTYLLAWTTTPWSCISVMGLAVGENFKYQLIESEGEQFIVAEKRVSSVMGERKYKIVKQLSGKEIVGLSYEHLFDFYNDNKLIKENKNVFKTYPTDYVSEEEGTGIVTINGAFGDVDMQSAQKFDLPVIVNVDDEGKFNKEVTIACGMYIKDAEKVIIEDLQNRNLLLKTEEITHSYPLCYRCETPLIYKAQDSWFINVQKLKPHLLETNEKIHWVPEHFKHGRFEEGIKSAPDWCISRTRYWATAMPIWECEKCEEREVFGSIAEIEKRSGQKVTDLHRPFIDTIIFPCKKCNGEMHRISDVVDCWLESGSMPYAERHYPFENEKEFKKSFPADYISEYTGQVRAWFYVLHVLSNALFDSPCFKNVVVSGVVMGTDGRKMSKSFHNYPDPREVIEKYGGDALRLYLMGSPTMAGQDMNVSEEGIKEQAKKTMLILWNCYNYFVTFATLHEFDSDEQNNHSNNILDKWLLSRINNFVKEFTKFMDDYHIPEAVRLLPEFLDDLSRWYIRRSRNRFEEGSKEALNTLFQTLNLFVKTTAPLIPFITEAIYQNIDKKLESIHLELWPKYDEKLINKQLEEEMKVVRKICEEGNALRKEKGFKLRQPLAGAIISGVEITEELQQVIKEELNIKKVEIKKTGNQKIELNTELTAELIAEGEAREIVRQIQEARKEAKCGLKSKIEAILPKWPKDFEEYIKEKTLTVNISKGEELTIREV